MSGFLKTSTGEELIRRFWGALPFVYALWAAPFLLCLALLMPPFQNPDEVNHELRAVQVARGELVGVHLPFGVAEPTNAGGLSDPGVLAASDPFAHLKFHSEERVSKSDFEIALRLRFSKSELLEFGNTAMYPPFLYAPSVVAIRLGQIFDATIVRTLYLSRVANGIFAITLTVIALWAAQRTRWALCGLAMLPMTSSLYVSASQDALLISLCLLIVGLVDRICTSNRPASNVELSVIVVAASLVGMGRPPYGVLALLPFALVGSTKRRGFISAFGIAVCCAAWSIDAWIFLSVKMNGADASVQFGNIFHHPFEVFDIGRSTLMEYWAVYWRQFIGSLGWLDTPLPDWFTYLAALALGAAFCGSLALPTPQRSWLPLGLTLLGTAAVFGAQYLTWTRPFAPLVDGVQGRYFLPLAPFLALSLPTAPLPIRSAFSWLAGIGVLFLVVSSPVVVVETLLLRYYLIG